MTKSLVVTGEATIRMIESARQRRMLLQARKEMSRGSRLIGDIIDSFDLFQKRVLEYCEEFPSDAKRLGLLETRDSIVDWQKNHPEEVTP
jgi:hypothetical protein